MKKYLILVKHSVPEIIESLSAHEWKLSEEGRAYAARLADVLTAYQPEVIVSSNEPKAKETAEIIAKSTQLNVSLVENLHEHDRGNVPYLSRERFHALIREFFQKPDTPVFGEETANQAHKRFSDAVHSVLKFHTDKTVAIVAHGTVISLYVSRLTGISDFRLWNELGLPSYIVLDLDAKTIIARANKI